MNKRISILALMIFLISTPHAEALWGVSTFKKAVDKLKTQSRKDTSKAADMGEDAGKDALADQGKETFNGTISEVGEGEENDEDSAGESE